MAAFPRTILSSNPPSTCSRSLGWRTANLMGEFAGGESSEGRASKRDAILPKRLRLALKRLNPDLPQEALDDAFSAITRERGAIDPIRANAEIHELLREGVKVEMRGTGRRADQGDGAHHRLGDARAK